MALVVCGSKNCWWNKNCLAKRQCTCDVCPPLAAIDLNLQNACNLACNSEDSNKRPTNTEQFLCDKIGSEELWSRYHLRKCGYNPFESVEAKQQEKAQAEINQQTSYQQKIIWALVMCVGFGFFILLLKKFVK